MQLARKACEIHAKAGLWLQKFVSNSISIPTSVHATDIKTKDLAFSETKTERELCIHWNIKRDCFTFNITLKDQPHTPRGLVSTVAAVYGPIRFVIPYLLNGKRILQEMY